MSLARRLLFSRLERIREGSLELSCGGRTWRFGESGSPASLAACVEVHDPRLFSRAVFGGDVGMGEAYVDGFWSSPDVVAVVRLAVRNMEVFDNGFDPAAAAARLAVRLRHLWRRNSRAGSRANIRAHYDLGNEFYRLFLDERLIYSCGLFEREDDSLERAQIAKLDRVCERLELSPSDRVLEIGTGWGGFAIHAARRFGCRVTSTTISREQFDYARQWVEREGLAGRVEILQSDYRDLSGRYDKIVSIEMFEAVGLSYYDAFFAACDRLLSPGGTMFLQTITMNERRFRAYRRRPDFIQRHLFPGAELASLVEIQRSLARATGLTLAGMEEIGPHYVATLRAWRRRFHDRLEQVRALGFDERFVRMWDYYLAYCEGAFAERAIGNAQLLLSRARPLALAGQVPEEGRGPYPALVVGGKGLGEDREAAGLAEEAR